MSYRAGCLNIGDYDDRIPDDLLDKAKRQYQRRRPRAVAPKGNWLKPLMAGSGIILGLAVLILSAFPSSGEGDLFTSLILWVFAMPLGSIMACMMLASLLNMVSLLFDKTVDVINESQFELVFLAALLVGILFTYAYINMVREGKAEASQLPVADSTTMFSSVKEIIDNLFLIVIIGDYFHICVEWLKKNHLTVFGFALLIISFYLLYALP